MRKTLVAGNWKLNGSIPFIIGLVDELVEGAPAVSNVDMLVCPSYVYLPLVAERLQNTAITVGAQAVSSYAEGAYTGEVSAAMLKDIGCQYGIVGHSERRSLFVESSEVVAQQFSALKQQSITPILCVGESLEQRDQGLTESIIAEQLDAVIHAHGVQSLAGAVVAYEPVWAIGTGKTASPEQAQAVHAFIRQRVAEQDQKVADNLQILYGGSLKADNAANLFAMQDIDGGLIGGASLKANDFLAICQAGQAVAQQG